MTNYGSVSSVALAQAVVDQDRPWARVGVTSLLLNELRVADVRTVEGRAAALENITSIVQAEPYSIVDGTPAHATSLRFGPQTTPLTPSFALLSVALFRDGWQTVFDNLVDSLTGAVTEEKVAQYYVAISIGGTLLRNSIGVYNYRTFEVEYSLTWA
jgi:hypothetical protein